MGYPQPDADQYAINGYDFFRLNTLLASPGDIYESAQGGHALAIGPDSDIASVIVNYFDQQNDTRLNELVISQNRSFVSRIDANNLGTYLPAARPAKVLIWPNDLWNPEFFPFFTGNERSDGSTQILEVPRLDVIEYFQPQESLVPKRSDKTWFYQTVTTPLAGGGSPSPSAFITIPYYGRRYAKIRLAQHTGSSAKFDFRVYGVDLEQQAQIDPGLGVISIGNVGLGTLLTEVTAYQNVANVQFIVNDGSNPLVPAGAQTTADITRGGMFDLLTIMVSGHGSLDRGQSFFLKIITSDEPGGMK